MKNPSTEPVELTYEDAVNYFIARHGTTPAEWLVEWRAGRKFDDTENNLTLSEALAIEPGTLHVYYAEPDKFVAESMKEATAMAVTHGHHPGDLERNEYPEELPDDKVIGIFCDDSGAISDSGNVVKRTAADWAARNGKGFLCTEEL